MPSFDFARAPRALLPLTALLVVAGCATPRVEPRPARPGEPTFGTIRVEPRDIYDVEEQPGLFYELVNFLNVTVRDEVVQKEVDALFVPGDPFDPKLLDELERNLRALPFIGHASVEPIYREDGKVDVDVKTRDRFTLRAGIGFGSFGGAQKFRATLAEEDFFGTGKRVQTTYKTDPDRDTLEFKFTDPQFYDGNHLLNLKLATTSDGYEYILRFEKPFKTLATEWSYGGSMEFVSQDVNYYDKGDDVASIPLTREQFELFTIRSYGTREDLVRPGFSLSYRQDDYGRVEGPEFDLIEEPLDTRVLSVGPTLSRDWLPRFEKRTRLDAIDFVEDVPIGFKFNSFTGPQLRDPEGEDPSLSLAFAGDGHAAWDPHPDHLLTFGGALAFRQGNEPLGWSASSFVHYYFSGLPWQTWVASVALDGKWDNEDLNTQLTLGEDNGLRGYPAREFAGYKRVRFNLEDRIFTDLEILSIHICGAVFFDAGMVWNRGEPMRLSDLARSVGFGLRLGSSELLGKNVVRIDLGFPLDEIDGETYGVSLSASVGQIVSLFKNFEGLGDEIGFDL